MLANGTLCRLLGLWVWANEKRLASDWRGGMLETFRSAWLCRNSHWLPYISDNRNGKSLTGYANTFLSETERTNVFWTNQNQCVKQDDFYLVISIAACLLLLDCAGNSLTFRKHSVLLQGEKTGELIVRAFDIKSVKSMISCVHLGMCAGVYARSYGSASVWWKVWTVLGIFIFPSRLRAVSPHQPHHIRSRRFPFLPQIISAPPPTSHWSSSPFHKSSAPHPLPLLKRLKRLVQN